MNAMEEKHLTIETMIDGEVIDKQDINDPFLTNRTVIEMSIWDRLKFLFSGRIAVVVRVRGDKEAHNQWFRTDPPPLDPVVDLMDRIAVSDNPKECVEPRSQRK